MKRARHLSLAVVTCLALNLVTQEMRGQNVTVQLPTFQVFSVATTVVVPDRGSMYLGGVNRAAYGSSTSGVPGLSLIPGVGRLFTNRGIGSEISSTSARATATIMDLEELDKAVLAEAAAARAGTGRAAAGYGGTSTNPAVERKAAWITKHVAKTNRSQLGSSPPPNRQPER